MNSDKALEEFLAESRSFSATWWKNEFASSRDLWQEVRTLMIRFAEYEMATGARKQMPDMSIWGQKAT